MIPPTKQDDLPNNDVDVPLLFTKMNSTGQHIISCGDHLFITGSPAKRQDRPQRQNIPHGKRVYVPF